MINPSCREVYGADVLALERGTFPCSGVKFVMLISLRSDGEV